MFASRNGVAFNFAPWALPPQYVRAGHLAGVASRKVRLFQQFASVVVVVGRFCVVGVCEAGTGTKQECPLVLTVHFTPRRHAFGACYQGIQPHDE